MDEREWPDEEMVRLIADANRETATWMAGFR
jgi:hypothetical protein